MVTASTQTKILEVAARLFHEQGYAATGISTILREADVHSGSLYHFFPSKEALLEAVLDRYVELLRPVILAPAEEATNDPIERVFAMLRNYREFLVMTDFGMGCPIGNLALEVSGAHPAIREKIALNFANWCGGVRGWLEAAGDRLPGDVDRDGLSRFILTVMEGGVMQARAHRAIQPYDDSVRQLRDYFERLMTDAADKKQTRETTQ